MIMKAMVVSIKGKRAAVLAHDGTFNEIKNKNYRVGQVLEYKQHDLNIINFTTKHSSKIAAAAALVLLVTGTMSADTYAYSTVTLDVNPSLRYELNIFDRVVDLDSYNNDGEEIADLIRKDIKGKKIDKALDITFDALEDAEYIEEDTPVVVTVTSHMGREEKLKDKTLDEMENWNRKKQQNGENEGESSISGNIVVITRDELNASEKKNESPGRDMLDQIKQLQDEESIPDHKQPPQDQDTEKDISSDSKSAKGEEASRIDLKPQGDEMTTPKDPNDRNAQPKDPNGGNAQPKDPNGGNAQPKDPNGGNAQPKNPNGGNVQPKDPNGGNVQPKDPNNGNVQPQNPNDGNTQPQEPNNGNAQPQDPNNGNVLPLDPGTADPGPQQDPPPEMPEDHPPQNSQPPDTPPEMPGGESEGNFLFLYPRFLSGQVVLNNRIKN